MRAHAGASRVDTDKYQFRCTSTRHAPGVGAWLPADHKRLATGVPQWPLGLDALQPSLSPHQPIIAEVTEALRGAFTHFAVLDCACSVARRENVGYAAANIALP